MKLKTIRIEQVLLDDATKKAKASRRPVGYVLRDMLHYAKEKGYFKKKQNG